MARVDHASICLRSGACGCRKDDHGAHRDDVRPLRSLRRGRRRREAAGCPDRPAAPAIVTQIRRLLTAAMVGLTSRKRLFLIRTGSVSARMPARNSEIINPSKEVRKENRAAETTPGRLSGSTTRRKTPQRSQPKIIAARSRFGSTACNANCRITRTTGSATTAWRIAIHGRTPIRPNRAERK